MYEDPILQEIYEYREKIAAQFNYDIHKICEYLSQQDLSLTTFKPLEIFPSDRFYPLCLRLQGLETLTDRSELCQELCTLSYATIDPQFETLDIPENVDNPAKLISKLLILRKILQKPDIALIFDDADPTGELLEICDRLHRYFPILWISDRFQPYPSISPREENLSQLIQNWLNHYPKIHL